ncbi:MAG: hypothetical protein RLZ45_1080 [Verrucomicrobiota bacterium]
MRPILTLPLLALILAQGCGPGPATSPGSTSNAPSSAASTLPTAAATPAAPWFKRVGPDSGLDFRHHIGPAGRFYLPEMESGGVGLIDYNRDGRLDVLCIDGGSLDPAQPQPPQHRLYRNDGGWRFTDVTEAAGLHVPSGFGMGCTIGDYDRDGWPDLYITQYGGNHLFHNRGDGTFEEATQRAGVGVDSLSTSAAFLDYDTDGHLDLIVVNYVRWTPQSERECFSSGGRRDYCSPLNYQAPAPPVLFHNRGDGTFEDVTREAGLLGAFGNGLGVATGDFDKDGRVDLFIANDAMANQLWLNQGGGRFRDDAPLRGCALNAVGVPRAGMGVVAVDLLQRGSLDLFVTHLVGEGNGLFLNEKGIFTDWLAPDGPMAGSQPFTGFGVEFADFDNNGQLDLQVANGRVKLGLRETDPKQPYAEPNTLKRGLGQGRFQDVPFAGLDRDDLGVGRGLAVGDLDNDGALDVLVVRRDAPLQVLQNRAAGSRHWIMLQLEDGQGRETRNAVIRVEAAGQVLWRQHQPNQGYASSQDPRVHFGLGAAQRVDHVWIRGPDGRSEDFGPLPADRIHTVRQGGGQPAPGAFPW